MAFGGDQLARGAKSASFPASSGNISQEKWDKMWATDEPKEEKDGNSGKRKDKTS